MARQLASKGNQVVATVRQPSKAKELQSIENVIAITELDVSSIDSIQKWALDLKSHVSHVDYLINNAGIADTRWPGLDGTTYDWMLDCFKVNTLGPLFCTKELYDLKLIGGEKKKSTVVNITSKMGSVDDNGSGGAYAYRASKAALNIVNKSLSLDLRNITSVLLHPGYVQTDMTNNHGLITTKQCVEGLIGVLESGLPLQGRWYDYKKEEIPW